MFKKISPGDWALILSCCGGALITFVGAVTWLNNHDARISAVEKAQAQDHDERKVDQNNVWLELKHMDEQLNRIEGKIEP